MRPVALLVLSVLLLGVSPHDRRVREYRRAGDRGPGVGSAAFEVFPSSGVGTPGVCSTTAPTGTKGEAATITRATDATCQATAAGGMVSSGIGNGELSTVASGVIRVEYDRDGVKGARIEGARTNLVLRNTAIDNAAWVVLGEGGGAAASKGVADSVTAPDGTASGDPVTFAATTATQGSFIYQDIGSLTAADITSTYLKASSGTCALDVCEERMGPATSCTTCNINATTWTRCSVAGASSGAGSRYVIIGNASARNGGTARSACTATPWGPQTEGSGATFGTSLIYTAGATVTRNADVLSFPVTLAGTTFSAAISYDTPAALVTGATAFQVFVDANNSVTASVSAAGKLTCTFRIGGSDSTVTSTADITAGTVNRVACLYGATGRSACVGGVCDTTAGALVIPTGAASFYVGTRSTTGNEANGVLSRGCYDASRCI